MAVPSRSNALHSVDGAGSSVRSIARRMRGISMSSMAVDISSTTTWPTSLGISKSCEGESEDSDVREPG